MTRLIYPLATGVLFSGSYLAGKYTTLDLGPLTTTLLRYAVALVFLLLLIPRCEPGELRLRRADLGWLLVLSLAGVIGYHYFFFSSLRHTLVANTALINALSPIMTGAAAAVFLGERLAKRLGAAVETRPVRALDQVSLEIARGEKLATRVV